MLAQNFKTAAQLKISDGEIAALITVLGMFERGEIKREEFFMGDWCGTACCICGHVTRIDRTAFQRIYFEGGLKRLFIPGSIELPDGIYFADIAPAHAAIALRNYLTTGEPRWGEVFAH